jgi:hypothetical protein
MVGLDVETVRNVAVAVVAVAIVLAVVVAWLVRAIVSKLVVVGVLALLVAVVWQQRTAVQDCAERVSQTLAAGVQDVATCTFFGRDVTVASPLG